MKPASVVRRQALKVSLLGLGLPWGAVFAQPTAPIVFPYYSAAQALQGLYRIHLPSLAQAFTEQAHILVEVASGYCANPKTLELLRSQWAKTLMSWQALATPALGPILKRRSQRQIDFWPTRPALLHKALARQPQTLAELASIGSPAKGLPALEALLRYQNLTPDLCSYIVLLAQDIEAEAVILREEFARWASFDWTSSEDTTQTSMAEWINQWLGGWERLRWLHIEQPLQKARTRAAATASFARHEMATNVLEWQVQWHALRAQALLKPEQIAPPRHDNQLIPIEALLRGKGHLAIANRWSALLGEVGKAVEHLTAQPSPTECLAITKKMKVVTLWYQNEVAQALDIPLGFSDADGD